MRWLSSSTCSSCTRASSDKWSKENKDRSTKRKREWYRRNSDKQLDTFLIREYGITIDDYRDLLDSQNGSCAICHKTNDDGVRLSVDHDHKTGRVRGLLCRTCNWAVGFLYDDKGLALSVARYLGDK